MFIVMLPLFLLGYLYLKLQYNSYIKIPKNFSNKKFITNESEKIKHTTEINRDRFLPRKIPTDIDVIIIGSGIGGLVTAGLLSRAGKRCLVLEQHYIAGGSTHNFVEHGYEFDSGVHYVGNIKKRNKILNLITKNNIDWTHLGYDNDNIYDNLIIGDDKYSFKPGSNEMISYLSQLFPEEKENIEKYILYIKRVANMELFFLIKIMKPIWLAKLINYLFCSEFRKIANKSITQVLDEFFINTRLKSIIGGLSIDGGPPPSNQSFFIHASILNHFIEGGFYPVGGCGCIAENIIPIIEDTGGRVLVNAPVTKILIDSNKAYGIQVKDQEIHAPIIVSNTGIRNTYWSLLPTSVPLSVSNYFDDVLNTISSNLTYNFLFVGFDTDSESLGLNSSNIYCWPEESFDDCVNKYEKEPYSGTYLPPMFIASNSAKDSSWNKRYPGKSTVCVISWSNTDIFNSSGEPNKNRETEYINNKKCIENMMWKVLLKHFPKCKDHIKYTSTATGESVKYYLGSFYGECYGLDATTKRFNFFNMKPKTNIKNLYLTGQDIVTTGFAGAMTAGILTASDILGYGTIPDIISGKNLIEDIMHLDKK